MTFRLLIAVAIALGDSGGVLSQKQPDFSGRWVAEADYDRSEDGRETFCDGGCEIEQDSKTLTVRRVPTGAAKTYRLDGTPVRTVSESNGYATEITTTATWSGQKLVIVTKVGRLPATTMIVSLEKGRLTVVGARRSFDRRRAATQVTYARQSNAGKDRRD